MSSDSKAKYKAKNYFKHQKSRRRGVELNSKGFLCSCNNQEKDCVKEAYNILNEYHDKATKSEEQINPAEDVSDSLSQELSTLRQDKTKKFQVVDSGAKNFLFIHTTIEDPVGLAHSIVKDIYETGTQKTKTLLRLVPVQVTCRANIPDILSCFEKLAGCFSDCAQTFCVVFNHRNNNTVSRDEVIKAVADKVLAMRDDHKVDLKNAKIAIVVEVIKGIAFLGLVPDYWKYKKYNLLVCKESE